MQTNFFVPAMITVSLHEYIFHCSKNTNADNQMSQQVLNHIRQYRTFHSHKIQSKKTCLTMAVGTGGGGQGGGAIVPPIFCQPKKFKSLKITTHKSVYSNKDKIGF